jgi:hypothetical protein
MSSPASEAHHHRRRRAIALAALAILVLAGIYLGTKAGGTNPSTGSRTPAVRSAGSIGSAAAATVSVKAKSAPAAPRLLVTAVPATSGWRVVARVHGRPGAWISERGGVTMLRFDQSLVHLALHAGSSDGGTVGWKYGDRVTPAEIHRLVATFNGGFKLTYGHVGFVSGGHVAVPLSGGLGSIVTYTDGTTAIGAWRAGVPSATRSVYSVLQNERLLVDHGLAASTATTCILACFGATVGSRTVVARSGLGITRGGELVWAAGNSLTPAGLAQAMISAGVLRAVELDINPDWVAGYLYPHHPSGPSPVPVIPGQRGIAGELLEPYSRDFFAVIANY